MATAAAGSVYDEYCRTAVARCPNVAIAWFLMASWAYYHADDPIISDGLYDDLARMIAARWDELRHWHKPLLRREDLEAGSAFSIPAAAYPLRTIGAAQALQARTEGTKSPPPAESRPPAAAAPQLSLF